MYAMHHQPSTSSNRKDQGNKKFCCPLKLSLLLSTKTKDYKAQINQAN